MIWITLLCLAIGGIFVTRWARQQAIRETILRHNREIELARLKINLNKRG